MTNYKLDLKTVLSNLDHGNKDFFNSLSDEEKKSFQPFVLMRFMSSVQNSEYPEIALISINEIVNKHFWDISREVELNAKLLAACGYKKNMFHKWIPNKISKTNAVMSFVRDIFNHRRWHCNKMELDIFINKLNLEQLEGLCSEYGKSKEETSKITKDYKANYM